MPKVVINSCYGGFSLSLKGQAAYLARKGETAFFYKEDRSRHLVTERVYNRLDEAPEEGVFSPVCAIEDFGPCATFDQIWGEQRVVRSNYDLERDDPDLVAVVEELGSESYGSCAVLSVVDVPDDVKWTIEEYDGLEHVAETHRTWH